MKSRLLPIYHKTTSAKSPVVDFLSIIYLLRISVRNCPVAPYFSDSKDKFEREEN